VLGYGVDDERSRCAPTMIGRPTRRDALRGTITTERPVIAP